MHDVKSDYLKSNNLNTEEQPAIVPKKGSKDSLAGGQPDGFYVTYRSTYCTVQCTGDVLKRPS